jgi:hypothetical protein
MVGICSTIWLKIISLNLYCFLQLSDVHRYHDGAEITSSEHVKLSESGESYKLELQDAHLSDCGVYKCKIVNRLGEKTHEAKLSLICKLSFSGTVIIVTILMSTCFSLLLLHYFILTFSSLHLRG